MTIFVKKSVVPPRRFATVLITWAPLPTNGGIVIMMGCRQFDTYIPSSYPGAQVNSGYIMSDTANPCGGKVIYQERT